MRHGKQSRQGNNRSSVETLYRVTVIGLRHRPGSASGGSFLNTFVLTEEEAEAAHWQGQKRRGGSKTAAQPDDPFFSTSMKPITGFSSFTKRNLRNELHADHARGGRYFLLPTTRKLMPIWPIIDESNATAAMASVCFATAE